MDPHSFIARAEAQRWLGIAEKLLMGNDLVGSKTFAIRARESDPRLEAADQILAIVDTLLAADKRIVGTNGIQQPDFYAILQLVRFIPDTDHIASQYRRLAVLLNPHQNRFPYSDQAFQLVNDAWTVLSNPIRKSLYDADLDFPQQPQQMNTLGFDIEQLNHHQHQHQHQQHNQQQHQHNFFSINRMGTNREQELQPRVSQSHPQLQQHNFLSPVRSVEEQLFQSQVQPFQVTSTPPPPPQVPFSWPQPPPPPQPPLSEQQKHQQQQVQQESQHIDSNNDSRNQQTELDPEAEAEADVDDSPSFWTTCPYCFYMYEYPSQYAECVLRCNTCKRAFQAVRVPSPPQIVEGQDSYFYCWGFFPLAISTSHMQKDNSSTQKTPKWAPFSPMCDVSTHVQSHLNAKDLNAKDLNAMAAPKKNVFVSKNLGSPIYIDDETDDIFEGISEPSDDSDNDWDSVDKKKAKRMKKDRVKSKNVSKLPVSESGKKSSGVTTRRQSGRAGKEMGKLDLNVEFNNNEGEEPAARTGGGNRGNAQGDGDNIEGIGFFEGLDEFFSSLPILSVVNDEKVKAG